MASRNGKFGVGILLDAENRVTGPAEQAARSMMILGRDVAASGRVIQTAMQSAAGGIAVMAAGLKGLKGMFSIANEAGKFTQEMAAVESIIGATSKEFVLLEKTALQAGLATQFSPLQAAQTMRALAQAGLTARDAMNALRPSLDLSAASLGKLAPEKAAQTLNSTLKVFQMTSDQSKKAMNSLINATNRFNISIQDLPIGIGNVARGAIALKQDMDSTLAVLGLAKNVMPQMGSAATLTSSAMLRIADATVQKQFKKLGVNIKDARGNFLPLISIFDNFNNVLKKKFTTPVERTAVVTKLLGKRAIAPFAAVTAQLEKGVPVAARLTKGMKGITIDPKSKQAMLKGAQAIQFLQLQFKAARGEVDKIPKSFIGLREEALKVQKQAGKGGGTGDLFVQKLLGTFRGQITLLKGAWESFMIAVGKPLIAAFKPWVSMMFHGLGKITKFIVNMNTSIKETIARLGVSASVSTMLVGAVIALKAAFLFLKPVLGAALLPFVKILAVVALLTLAAEGMRTVWNKNMGGIRTAVLAVWAGIKKGFNEFIGPLMNELIPFLGSVFTEVVQTIMNTMVSWGLVSKDTTSKTSAGWMDVGRVIFQVFAFFIKVLVLSIAGVMKLVGWIATLIGWLGKAFGLLGRFVVGLFGGGKKVLPVAQISAQAGGKKMTVTQNQPTTIAPTLTAARTPIGIPGIKAPSFMQTGTTTREIIQQRTAGQGLPMQGTVLLDKQRVGSIMFGHQRQNQSRGLIRTTAKEQ